MTSISIPDSVTFIGNYVFNGCTALTSIAVGEANAAYCSRDGVLFNKAKTSLICYPAGKTGTYEIPDGVTNIDYGAFRYCAWLTGVTIPDSVDFIRYWAFHECTGLTSVTIPGGVYAVLASAFFMCSNLESVQI